MLRITRKTTPVVFWLLGLLYVSILVRNLNESQRRSLRLHADARTADNVRVPIRILSADLNRGEVTAVLGFELRGDLGIDAATPAVDLKLLLSTSRGPTEVDFPRGRRMNPVEAVFGTTGNPSRYPFDQHTASLGIRMVARGRAGSGPIGPSPAAGAAGEPRSGAPSTGPSEGTPGPTTALGSGQPFSPVPIEVDLSASVPGVQFQRNSRMGRAEIGFSKDDLATISLYMRRAENVTVLSIAVMLAMLGLSTGVLFMVLEATVRGKESPLLPLSLSVSLIFGLPALRNLQPAIPPLGVLSDYLSFVWAELIVAGSAIFVLWTWGFRARATGAKQR